MQPYSYYWAYGVKLPDPVNLRSSNQGQRREQVSTLPPQFVALRCKRPKFTGVLSPFETLRRAGIRTHN